MTRVRREARRSLRLAPTTRNVAMTPMPQSSPHYAVLVQNGRGELVTIPLVKDRMKFGRRPSDNDVCLADPDVGYQTEVARGHFEIRWDAASSAHVVVDYGQRYPIRISGVTLSNAQQTLKVGDVIEIGRFKITYIASDAQAPDSA